MNSKAKLTGIAPQLIVMDVVKTAKYYRDVLGFTIIGYFSDPAVYAMVERDGFQIHFGKADGAEIKTNEQFRKINTDFYWYFLNLYSHYFVNCTWALPITGIFNQNNLPL